MQFAKPGLPSSSFLSPPGSRAHTKLKKMNVILEASPSSLCSLKLSSTA
ncbi:hypothetical protein Patl1_27987 [Pistacia atlantica]|uniref:Uncharacterized protein n=1 Tax=Pistacia atlantica TaxID=434234 RepID=A0ACC1BF97_9ROSI|nr:hypothetical protein Patl1_27987 [Pistacia atlantica]